MAGALEPCWGVYLHLPFCKTHCPYCHFFTVPYGRGRGVEPLLGLLAREIDRFGSGQRPPADTVYFGGGTPSLLAPDQVAALLSRLRSRFLIAPAAEITLEMNPDDAELERCRGLVQVGINRISLGVQSLRDRDLAALGRRHDRAQVVRAVERLRRAGCANLSLDLIGGLPGQDRAAWRAILGRACELQPDHLSVYLLEVDPDQARHHPVLQRLPPDDQVARHYQLAVELLEARGYAQYEISNFARPGRASRHNLKYWTDAPYAGFGPAAHGYDGRRRHWNYADLAAYRAAVLAGRPPVAGAEEIGAQRRAQDALMLGLRLNHGLDLLRFEQRYGWRAPVAVIERLARAGLVVLEGDRLLLTLRGRLLSNSVLAELALDPGGCNEPAEGRRLGRRRPSQDAWATS